MLLSRETLMDLSFARLIKAGKPGPDNRRIYCNDGGVFIGPDCALIRAETDCAGHTSYKLRARSEPTFSRPGTEFTSVSILS